MATQVQNRRGSTSEHASFTGAVGEITVDTDKDVVVVHDGSTAGGHPALKQDGSNSALALGSASSPSLKFTGDTNTGLFSPGNDQLALATGGTGRLFVDASGNVGLNASTPNSYGAGYNVFTVNGSTSPVIDLNVGGTRTATFYAFSTNTLIGTQTSTPLQIITNGTEKARITSDGKLGLGTSSPQNPLVVSNGDANGLEISSATNSGTTSYLLSYNRNTSAYTDMRFDASAFRFEVSATERMRIGASGNVGIGQSDEAGIRLAVTSTGTAYAGYFSYPGSTAQGVGFNSTGAGSSYAAYFFNNGTNVGSIYTTSSSTSYNTSSDYRLKENVVPLTGAIDRINELQVHRFNFIADPGKTVDGFIAHEAQAVVPECVTGEKDAVDDNGNPVYQGIDQSKLVPLLTAALQEALTEIESLKARVTALDP